MRRNCGHWRALVVALIGSLWLLSLPALTAAAVTKSPNDPREYESFLLPNQLKALIISDPATDKAAAALDVYVGSSSDPEGWEGLAHFLEHMLFLGTEKYPQAGEYQSFISEHGGRHNAYTSDENTNYFFDVDKNYLEPALDRFSQFFVAPLFTPQYVERERNAVDSEYQARRKDDSSRLFHAWKTVANPGHPFSRFQIGSLKTLVDRSDLKLREALIKFYRQHYSANIMTLVVLGKEPLPALKQWVTQKFSAVKNVDAKPFRTGEPLWAAGTLPARLNVVPLEDRRVLAMTFPIPPVIAYWQSKPVNYVANLLGYEGEGSLLSLLKKRGWVETLSAGLGASSISEATFSVSMQLTEQGLEHVDEIVSYAFRYIDLIREQGISERIFDEQRRIAEMDFRFQEKASAIRYASMVAANLQIYPAAEVLRGPYAMDHYDPALIRRFLDELRPEHLLLTVNAKGLPTDAEEPWFAAPYALTRMSEALIARARAPAADARLAIPGPNIFLPDDLALKTPKDATHRPVRIRTTPGLQLWFQQDATFKVPRADFYFSLRSPLANDSPQHAVLTELYVKLVNDQLNEFAYPAYLAGLNYELYKHLRGITVRISGYSDKQAVLLSRVVDALAKPVIDPRRFAIARDELVRDLKNVELETPYRQTTSEINKLLLRPYWTEEERLAALEALTAADLGDFVPKLLRQINIVALAHGNLSRTDALASADILQQRLLASATATDVPAGEVLKLPSGEEFVRLLSIDHPDSALTIYLQGANKSYATQAKTALTAQIVSTPFYNDLRTEKQLGYVVFASSLTVFEVPGIAFVVQSPNTNPAALEKNVVDFIRGYANVLHDMREEEFARHKQALLTRIMQKDRNLQARSNRFWNDIDRKRYKFDSRERLAKAVRRIDKKVMERYYRDLLLGKRQRRLIVLSAGTNHGGASVAGVDSSEIIFIKDSSAFKQQHRYFPR